MGLFKSFKKLTRSLAKPVSQVASAIPGGDIILPAAAAFVGGPAAGAAFSGANTYGRTGSLGAGLGAAGGSFLGGQLGSAYGAASDIGMGGAAGPNFLGSVAGGAAGSYAGSGLGEGLGLSIDPMQVQKGRVQSGLPSGPSPRFLQSKSGGLGSAFSGLDPLQARTRIATEDVYGGGADAAQKDFLNTETNNRLLQEGSNYDLTPIEEQYFQRQGYSFNPGNKASLLEAFARRYA